MTALNLPQDAQSLPYGHLVVGMPVITDHMDQPCTLMVAVFTGFSGVGAAKTLYLADWKHHTREVFASDADDVTPIGAFAVGIELDESRGLYRCVKIDGVEATARHRDRQRSLRWWMFEHERTLSSGQEWWPYRPSVLAMLDRRWLA
jgi:hypothetical protein